MSHSSEQMTMENLGRHPNPKNVYRIDKDLYTYGVPGKFGPRVQVVRGINRQTGARKKPEYVRVSGGEVPKDVKPEREVAIRLLEALTDADKTGEA